jgi:hypothetical protein
MNSIATCASINSRVVPQAYDMLPVVPLLQDPFPFRTTRHRSGGMFHTARTEAVFVQRIKKQGHPCLWLD